MRINKIDLGKLTTAELGLAEVNLNRLSSLVAFVGKNGSGKTRLLDLIQRNTQTILSPRNIINGNITHLPAHIKRIIKSIEPYKDYVLLIYELSEINSQLIIQPDKEYLKEQKIELENEIRLQEEILRERGAPDSLLDNENGSSENVLSQSEMAVFLMKELENQLKDLDQQYINRIEYAQIRSLKQVVEDSDADSFEKLVTSVTEKLEYHELSSIFNSSLKFLKKLPNQLILDWNECLGDQVKFQKRKSYKRYSALKSIFENLFKKTLEFRITTVSQQFIDDFVDSRQRGVWIINGREFDYNEFSDGERTLFTYVLMFFLRSQNNNIRLKDSILIIDEPELHLHPDAEIDLINGIREIIEENGQLFLATHSLNILANINYDEVFVVKDGAISHPSNSIQSEALSELMKIEDRVFRLSEFLNSISDWTYVRFMVECFTNPEVIEVASPKDPQVKSLKDIIGNLKYTKQSLLLDFGAGKGRLYDQTMNEHFFQEKVVYSALEPNEAFHSELRSKGVQSIYSSYEQLQENTFDFIVLCNVLHEMEIDTWIPTLNRIISALKADGYLIIMEAKILRKGERIGKTGFLLLDENELQVLFGIPEAPNQLEYAGSSDKITCVLFEKIRLKPVKKENLVETLTLLEKNTFARLEDLREPEENDIKSNYKGRLTAFLAQLNINARIALKHLKEKRT